MHRSSMHHSFAASAAVVAFALAAGTAPVRAQIATGSTLTFTGRADATDIGLGGVFLDFAPTVAVDARGSTKSFATPGGRAATAQVADIRVGNGFQLVPNFLTYGAYRFSLTFEPWGRYGQADCYTDQFAIGQRCTPYQSVQGNPAVNVGLSPFYLENVASGNPNAPINSTAAFDVYGTVSGPGGSLSSFTGTIGATFIGIPYQVALYTLEQQGLQGVQFTGRFTAGLPLFGGIFASAAGVDGVDDGSEVGAMPDDLDGIQATVTPEPSTLLLVAAGAGAAGLATRRRRTRA